MATMWLLGRIRSKQRCRSCHSGYKVVIAPATGDQVDPVRSCGARPTGLFDSRRWNGTAPRARVLELLRKEA